MSSTLNVLVVGCGNIAGGFDAKRGVDELPLTHAGAFTRHGKFRLAACIEPDDVRRQQFMDRWSIPRGHATFADLAARPADFDVISICSPTALHAQHLDAAVQITPRLIFCEKPVTPTLSESLRRIEQCESAGILLAVNHTRRWAPDVVRLRDELRGGRWGTLRSVVGHYNKGVLNNGGHLIDLLHYLIGPLQLRSTSAPLWDFWKDDPTIAATLAAESGVPVYLNTAHAGDYSFFELQLVLSGAVLTMEDGGLHWRVRLAEDSPHFPGYKSLNAGERRQGEYHSAMLNAVTNVYDALTAGSALASTGRTALEAQRLCDLIRTTALEPIGPSGNIP